MGKIVFRPTEASKRRKVPHLETPVSVSPVVREPAPLPTSVEHVIYVDRPVYLDRIVEKEVPKLITKVDRLEVPVEKIVQVPVYHTVEKKIKQAYVPAWIYFVLAAETIGMLVHVFR